MNLKFYKISVAFLAFLSCSLHAISQDYSDDITDSSTGIIKAVSEHLGSIPNLAEYAFDENLTAQGWANNTGADFPAWIRYQFPETSGPRNVVAYSIYCSDMQSNFWPSSYRPVRWTLRGENSEGNFLLDSVEMADIFINEWSLFEFENEQFFDAYTFTFYETVGNSSFTFITEMELYEPASLMSTLNQIKPKSQINVFPNPVEEILTISSKMTNDFDITLIDNLGQIVYALNDADLTSKLELNCFQYPTGTYTLHLESKEEVLTQRIIIH